ncbi:sperm-egg fusion protein TMEM95 isoform X1 [Bubalus bubalis]|uniref:sperm-egg fusion protein TMEM95 isoform X1 n=1 Tax=Bubalus bubalis TaxID=89462 RepID=UPI001D11ED0D|nr:sperm-egg fusion protein TMEM95 isoform X1 [Bubalus bubalis]
MPSQPRWGQPSLQQPPAGLMWTLALGGIFLAAVEACVFCRFPDRELSGRLAQLCSQMEVQWKDCEVSWTFSAFALDDASLNKITEKTHRVLRVMEIKGSLYSLPSYWQWLRKTKLREYNREALCPPACREGQHHPVQLFHLPGLRGVLLAPKALLPRSLLPTSASPPPRSLSSEASPASMGMVPGITHCLLGPL